jgi:hypothetical protein
MNYYILTFYSYQFENKKWHKRRVFEQLKFQSMNEAHKYAKLRSKRDSEYSIQLVK